MACRGSCACPQCASRPLPTQADLESLVSFLDWHCIAASRASNRAWSLAYVFDAVRGAQAQRPDLEPRLLAMTRATLAADLRAVRQPTSDDVADVEFQVARSARSDRAGVVLFVNHSGAAE